jgi:cytochrome P450
MTATHPDALAPSAPAPILPGLADTRSLTGEAARRARKQRVFANVPDRCYEEPIVLFKNIWGSALVVADPAGVKRVLVDNVANYPRGEGQLRTFRLLFGEGLLGADGDLWRRHRRIMAPAFDPRSVASYGPAITRACESFHPRWDAAPNGSVIDVGSDMSRLTLRIIAGTMFSADTDEVIELVTDTMKDGFDFGDFNLLDLLPIVRGWRMRQRQQRMAAKYRPLDAAINRWIAARREDPAGASADLLSRLTNARGEGGDGALSDREIRDEVITIFIAGRETTAQALSWTWYLLAEHPAVEARLHAELDEVLGGRTPVQGDLPKLAYTRQVIEESIRIYPTAPAFANRVAQADDEIGGFKVKKGMSIAIAPWLLHHHRRLWDDPNRFDPDRFLPERSAARHRFAYLPFGAGPRVCIGQTLAMNEAVLILASLAQRYRLRLAPDQVVQPQATLTLRPKYGLKMTLEQRRPSAAPR